MNKHCGTLCWDCKLAVGKCEWSLLEKPVPGWDATLTVVNDVEGKFSSYQVHDCPKFTPEPTRLLNLPDNVTRFRDPYTFTLITGCNYKLLSYMKTKGFVDEDGNIVKRRELIRHLDTYLLKKQDKIDEKLNN